MTITGRNPTLDGRKATTSWRLGKLFRAQYPRVAFCKGELVTGDERILSSGAFTGCLDLALRIVEQFAGPARRRSGRKRIQSTR